MDNIQLRRLKTIQVKYSLKTLIQLITNHQQLKLYQMHLKFMELETLQITILNLIVKEIQSFLEIKYNKIQLVVNKL